MAVDNDYARQNAGDINNDRSTTILHHQDNSYQQQLWSAHWQLSPFVSPTFSRDYSRIGQGPWRIPQDNIWLLKHNTVPVVWVSMHWSSVQQYIYNCKVQHYCLLFYHKLTVTIKYGDKIWRKKTLSPVAKTKVSAKVKTYR